MSDSNPEKREHLKEEYKKHFKQLRDQKMSVTQYRKVENIRQALRNMDSSDIMESFEQSLITVRKRLTEMEGTIDAAVGQFSAEESDLDEEMKKNQAKDTLRQLKLDMGLLYEEIELQAESLQQKKTVGKGSSCD